MRGRVWSGFAVLCVVAGSEWVADLLAPRVLPGAWGAGARMALLAGVFGLAGYRRSGRWGGWRLAAWGAGLLGVLPVITAAASGSVTGLTVLLVPALIPAMVVFALSQTEGHDDAFRLLVPALAAFAGMALLVAYTIPSTGHGILWLLALILAAGVAALATGRVHALLGDVDLLKGTATVCGGAALLLGAFGWVGGTSAVTGDLRAWIPAGARLLLVDAPVALLSVSLLRRMHPVQYSARYVLGLFVAVAESFAVARPGLDWTKVLAVLLVGGGCAMLLREG